MDDDNVYRMSASVVEDITHTLLYEGYSLYPYHRTAVKNQKPVPFGVVFPLEYNIYNEHAGSKMQTQCIIAGNDTLQVNISIRFLHLKKTEVFECANAGEVAGNDFIPVYDVNIGGTSYQAGWQTVERRLSSGDLQILQLIDSKKVILIEFDTVYDSKDMYDNDTIVAKQINSISAIKGTIIIEAVPGDIRDSFRLTVTVINATPVENAGQITRDEVLSRSFLSTHTILQAMDGTFISHQSPGEKWEAAIAGCENINTWPILIDESNTTLLSSPIILYDYPQINPQSSGDLFDSTEIEEALLLHVSLLSDEEKQRIAQSDDKLQAMLNKVSRIMPEELVNFHSGLKHSTENQISNEK